MDKSNTLDVNGQVLPVNSSAGGNFTQISNAVLLDERLSFKARGMLALLLSRPPGWQIYVNEIAKRSDQDGKRAVQSGFKELMTLGYVELLRVYNDETGRFEGTCYQLHSTLFLPRQPHFRTVREADRLENSPSEKQTDTNSDCPATASLSNTEGSNTKNRNTKNQQQQTKQHEIAAAEKKKNIDAYWQDIQADTAWQQLFVGQTVLGGGVLRKTDFQDLLLHFRQISLQNGTVYRDITSVKQHFGNWFALQQRKQNLPAFLAQQRIKRENIHTTLAARLRKTNQLYLPLHQRRCKDAKAVLRLAVKLQEHHLMYQQQLFYLEAEQRKTVLQAIANIELMLQRIERGKAAQQLQWFCECKTD